MDSSELLLSKENIQPLRSGRDTLKLCAGIQAQSDTDADRLLQQKRQEYETYLRDDTITDPLAVWYDYVIWMEQSYPSHTHKANINVVLKKCINKLKDKEEYKNDERFVKLCLKYATMNEDTANIFGLLYSNNIGKKSAIFYIAWADLFAMNNSLKKAATVYEKGINQLAQPIELLKDAERKFQAFMVSKMLNSGEIFQPSAEVYETGPTRQAYNKLRPINVGNKEVVPSVRVGSNVAAPGKFNVEKKLVSKTNSAFNIYEDGDDGGHDIEPTAKPGKLKSHSAMTKENYKKPGVWTNPDKKKAFSVPPVSLPFEVHVDDDDGKKPVKQGGSLSSALKVKQPHDEFNVDYAKTPLFWAEPYDPKLKPMYRKEQVYAGGLEFQFEELRAIVYRRRMAENAAKYKSQCTPSSVITPSESRLTSQSISTNSLNSGTVIRCEEREMKTAEKYKESNDNSSKPRVVYDSGRKSMKIRTSEEARSARRKIALNGDDTDKTNSARKSNFAGVRRRTLALDPIDTGALPKDAPSDSFINQTIHTKEAVNEMQELWFAKPVTPPQKSSQFAFYVDESCLGKEEVDKQTEPGQPHLRKIQCNPIAPGDENNKENAIPIDYSGPTGKSSRPVTGILTLAENVPFQPIYEDEEEEDERDSVPDAPGNTTGITETWNFTQAFSNPRIIHASTPNVRRSMFRPPLQDDSEPDRVEGASIEQNINLKEPASENWTKETAESTQKDDCQELKKTQQRTLGDVNAKNLSIIVETSREYKSSSSGSGASACSKLQPFTPGESRSEAHLKRFYSYSQAEDSRKTPFACKTQSTYGYEASAELSCTGPVAKITNDTVDNLNEISMKRLVLDDNKCIEESPTENNENIPLNFENQKGKITVDQSETAKDIDPFDEKLIDSLLERIDFPANHAIGFHYVNAKLPPLKLHSHVTLGSDKFDVKKVLGEGAYAKIFKVQNQKSGDVKVLKYQKPAFPWEFYIVKELQTRCSDPKLKTYFMVIEDGYFFENASLLVTSPVEYGDLLTAINLYKVKQGRTMSDFLALYFTVQILEIIQALHSMKIIHGDIKPDNFLVKDLNGKLTLELIDFGRSIDMSLFPTDTSFTRVVTTEGFSCIEMQTGRPWTYQLDLYGVACCVHCLLFGDYMKVIQKGGSWEISKAIPRYLAKSGWKQLFQILLNIPSCSELPDLSELHKDLLVKLEGYGPQPDLIKLTNFLQNR